MPLRPIPAGFAANTITYFLVLTALWHGLVAFARRIRIPPGRCRSCGYDVSGLELCPECGRAVKEQKMEVG